jgi:two-component system, NtrC family, sensor kinase
MKLPLNSLRQKITLGYYMLVVLFIALFILMILFNFFELRLFENKIEANEKITDFFDTMLEIRRFEKSYFLYHQLVDYNENQYYVAKALHLLQDATFDIATIKELLRKLNTYLNLMQQYREVPQETVALQIRQMGKSLIDSSEQLTFEQRTLQRGFLARQRNILLILTIILVIVVLILGRWLSGRVVKPLHQMETEIKIIAKGNLKKLKIQSDDQEIILLIEAFNKMLEEIEIRQRYLVRSEKLAALGTLLSGIAHELNNPLSNISSSCQILQEELHEIDLKFQQELLDQIDDQTNRARNIVRSLLDFTRVRPFRKEMLNLRKLLQETLQFLKGQTPIHLNIKIEIDESITILGDKQRLQQMFLNLLKNAIEAANQEIYIKYNLLNNIKKTHHLKNFVPCQQYLDKEGILIEISDDGEGIEPALLMRIFDPFFTTKEVGHGSGLGLFIVHEIIEEHQGCISVQNIAKGGAMFSIWLPLENN